MRCASCGGKIRAAAYEGPDGKLYCINCSQGSVGGSAAITTAAGPGEGVYYARGDYAGILRRLVIFVADSAIILGCGLAVLVLLDPTVTELAPPVAVLSVGLVMWGYLAVLKRSRFRTLGYRLADTKIVTLKGDRPSILRMTFRLLLWVVGPVNIFVDLFWVGNDDDSQTLRDRLAGTYVIRSNAEPIGRGRISFVSYYAYALALTFRQAIRPPEEPISQRGDQAMNVRRMTLNPPGGWWSSLVASDPTSHHPNSAAVMANNRCKTGS